MRTNEKRRGKPRGSRHPVSNEGFGIVRRLVRDAMMGRGLEEK